MKKSQITSQYLQHFKITRDKAEWIAEEQKKHRVDIAQPGTLLFEQAWGEKAKRLANERDLQIRRAKDEWREKDEQRRFAKERSR